MGIITSENEPPFHWAPKCVWWCPDAPLPKIKVRRVCFLRSSPSASHCKSQPLPEPQFLQLSRRTNQGGRGRGEVASRGPARFLRNSARCRGTPPALLKGSSEACGHKLPLPGKPKPRPGTATGREERAGVGEPPLRVRDTGAGRRREHYRGVRGRDLLAGPQVGWRSLVRGE